MKFLLVAAVLLVLGLLALWQAARQRRASGLPLGRVVYTDTGGWGKVEKPLFDPLSGLTGKPDYLVKCKEGWIPVEVKSCFAPPQPHAGHVLQLAAYCLLVERSTGSRPPYGLIRYRNRTFEVNYTPQLEAELLALVSRMRAQEQSRRLNRSHESIGRCSGCGYRSVCDQKLE
jgi:CRISPR-associated exonuclease Cas4